jgi:hypothetical protein
VVWIILSVRAEAARGEAERELEKIRRQLERQQ